jgi:hypothetical protein
MASAYFAALCLAQRFLCAAAILARAAALIFRLGFLTDAAADVDRPDFRSVAPAIRVRACCSWAISASIKERTSIVFMLISVAQRLPQ